MLDLINNHDQLPGTINDVKRHPSGKFCAEAQSESRGVDGNNLDGYRRDAKHTTCNSSCLCIVVF
jgi:hypothetical protein